MLTDRLIILCWSIFCGYWAVGSFRAKPSIGRRFRRHLPALLIVPAVGLLYFALLVGKLPHHDSPVVEERILGTALCALGVAIAIWARACLGENWGMPMTQREMPHLTTTGPYAYIRHPIYSGLLLGIIGTTLATSPAMLIGWPLIALVFFCISAIKEEQDMLKMFPDQYATYMSHTKRLVPFVW